MIFKKTRQIREAILESNRKNSFIDQEGRIDLGRYDDAFDVAKRIEQKAKIPVCHEAFSYLQKRHDSLSRLSYEIFRHSLRP